MIANPVDCSGQLTIISLVKILNQFFIMHAYLNLGINIVKCCIYFEQRYT